MTDARERLADLLKRPPQMYRPASMRLADVDAILTTLHLTPSAASALMDGMATVVPCTAPHSAPLHTRGKTMPDDLKQPHGYATYEEWRVELLAEARRRFPDDMDEYRTEYYRRPDWREYFVANYYPSEAIADDMTYWED